MNWSAALPRILAFGMLPLVLAAAMVLAAALPAAPLLPLAQALILGGVTLGTVLLYGTDERHSWLLTVAVLLVALCGRIAAMSFGDGAVVAADPMNYQNLARSILAGEGLVTADWQYGEGLRAHFPPLYPVLLAGIWSVFGEGAAINLGFSFVCDIITALAIYDIARRGGATIAGRIAALWFLLYPVFLIGAPLPHKESLTVMLGILLVRAMQRWAEGSPAQPARLAIAETGLWWGLLMLTQPSFALIAPCMGLALVPSRGLLPVLRFGFMAGLCAAVVMLPWWIRNYLVFGQFVPFTTAAGYLMNVQLGPNQQPFPPGLFALGEPDRGPVMAQAALSWIAANPIDHLVVQARQVANVFAYEEAAVAAYRHVDPPISMATRGWLTAALQTGWLLLIAGAAAGARRLQAWPRLGWVAPFVIITVASLLSVNIWFEFAERHRYVLTPIFLLLAALWWTSRRNQSTQR
jgi:hypothetical protein